MTLFAAMHVSAVGTAQPWQLPRRTAGHGSKADAGAQPPRCLPERGRRIADLDQEIERLQRSEEAIVVATGAPRERGCPPWVVLGVKAAGPRRPRRLMPWVPICEDTRCLAGQTNSRSPRRLAGAP